jgi:anti-sigma regulatory factor (Ser/Thr protein kinase)
MEAAELSDGSQSVRLDLPARAENMTVVRQALAGVADALDLDEAQLSDIKIAVTEACTNVVVHAYPDDSEGPLEVEIWPEDDRLVVLVRDHGRGFLPRATAASPGLGLGLPLIAALTEELHIATDTGPTTEVRMAFALAGVPG